MPQGAARADARLQAEQARRPGRIRFRARAPDRRQGGRGARRGARGRPPTATPRADHAAAPSQEIFEEIGDLLFAAANLARKLDVDAEAALRAANAKFERRFRAMEALAPARGEIFSSLDLAAQEASVAGTCKRAE